MARIRTVKPEYFDNWKMSTISIEANFVYVGMWVFSDDKGVVIANPSWLKSKIFPHRNKLKLSKFNSWITELKILGKLATFNHDGTEYFLIIGLLDHQRIDKPQPSKVPECMINQIRISFQESSKSNPVLIVKDSISIVEDGKGGESPTSPKEDKPQPTKKENFSTEPVLGLPPIGFYDIDICFTNYFENPQLQRTREQICITNFIDASMLKDWGMAFGRWLISEGVTVKTYEDFNKHFKNWLQLQNKEIDPNKLFTHEHAATKNGHTSTTANAAESAFNFFNQGN